MTANLIRELVEAYLRKYPDERLGLQLLVFQLENNDQLNNRHTLPGHMTGGAMVVSPDKSKLLLIYHKLFNAWMQPGGHWDPDESDPLHAARREAEEETAVEIADYLPVEPAHPLEPLHIESHAIPARPEKGELPHMHHDFTYAFVAKSEALHHLEHEVAAAQWFAFDAPECRGVRTRLTKLLNSGVLQR